MVLCIRQPQHTRNGQESQQRGVASIRELAPICKCRRKARKWHSERSEESNQPDSLPQAPAPQGTGFPSSIGCGPYRRASNARPYAPHFIRPLHTGRRGRRPLHRKLLTPHSTLHTPAPRLPDGRAMLAPTLRTSYARRIRAVEGAGPYTGNSSLLMPQPEFFARAT